jgi:chromosome partitioning protein
VKKITIINHKGGVGKTTLSFHLSGALAAAGHRVLAADCDSQGSLSATLLPNHESLPYSMADIFAGSDISTRQVIQPTAIERLHLIPADERLEHHDRTADYETDASIHALADALSEVEDDYDFLLFDCPPRRSLTAFCSLVAADEVIVPVECDVLSLHGIVKVQRKIEEARERLNPRLRIRGYVLSRYQPRAALQRTYRTKLEETFGADQILAVIPEMRAFANAMSYHQPITTHSPKSRAAAVIRRLAKELYNHDTYAQNQTTAA